MVIPTDGGVVFQPRKVQRSRLRDAVDGRVLSYTRKRQVLDDVEQRYPARHYVMVDDRPRIFASMTEVGEMIWQPSSRATAIMRRILRISLPIHLPT